MSNHRDPAPVQQFHAITPVLSNGYPDTPENRARMERVLDAAESFEIRHGKAVQVRPPVAAAPVAGVRYF